MEFRSTPNQQLQQQQQQHICINLYFIFSISIESIKNLKKKKTKAINPIYKHLAIGLNP